MIQLNRQIAILLADAASENRPERKVTAADRIHGTYSANSAYLLPAYFREPPISAT
jgi:hypothetical protein